MNIEQEIPIALGTNGEMKSQHLDKRKFDLEERLIDFAVLLIEISESVHTTQAGRHISAQIVRSGTSPAMQYGEAQNAELESDFIYMLKILLKELRETLVGLKIIKQVPLTNKMKIVDAGIMECTQLISLFNKSIETAKRK
jgi:four helix bundle protein